MHPIKIKYKHGKEINVYDAENGRSMLGTVCDF